MLPVRYQWLCNHCCTSWHISQLWSLSLWNWELSELVSLDIAPAIGHPIAGWERVSWCEHDSNLVCFVRYNSFLFQSGLSGLFSLLLCRRHVYLIFLEKDLKLSSASEKNWKQLVVLFRFDLITIIQQLQKETQTSWEGFAHASFCWIDT